MVKRVRAGFTASITRRTFATVASKKSRERFFGFIPYQYLGLNEPAIATQQRAPIASASARRSVTYSRLALRAASSGSSMFFHAPTSALTTFSAEKASRMARMRSASFDVADGQYAALYPSRR